MEKFNIWYENQFKNQIANDIHNLFSGNKEAFQANTNQKNIEYAKRIIAGEKPEVVMQGITPNGPFWNAVMQQVQALKGGNPAPSNTASIQAIENKLGIKNGTLSLQPSQDGKYIFVRNRLNGQSLSTTPDQQSIENTVKKLFNLV